jgi:hypothetical protein
MSPSIDHEEALVKAFIPAHRQERFLEIIAKPKKRAKLLTELSHFKALNPKFKVAIPSNQQNPSAVAKLSMGKGAGVTCYVMSENSELDGWEVDLEGALKETVGLRWAPSSQVYRENWDISRTRMAAAFLSDCIEC